MKLDKSQVDVVWYVVVFIITFSIFGFGCRIEIDDVGRLPVTDAAVRFNNYQDAPDADTGEETTANSAFDSGTNSAVDAKAAVDSSGNDDSYEGGTDDRDAKSNETIDAELTSTADAGSPVDAKTAFGCKAEPICPELQFGLQIGCCLEDDTCGWAFGDYYPIYEYKQKDKCHAFSQAGAEDDECDDININVGMMPGMTITIAGCCRPDGYCGYIIGDNTGCVAGEDVDGSNEICTPN